ncbi:MAG: hypothetical protein OSJ69_06550 [Acetatifactor sp.]|nr:hypothetical protein [Acetatifactor sp.]
MRSGEFSKQSEMTFSAVAEASSGKTLPGYSGRVFLWIAQQKNFDRNFWPGIAGNDGSFLNIDLAERSEEFYRLVQIVQKI